MLNLFSKTVVPTVSAEEVKEAIDKKSDVIIVDVRTSEEYQPGHINRSTLLPLSELPDRLTLVAPDKDKTIYVYCFSGSRSSEAVQKMINLGYTRAFSLPSGLLAWRQKGYRLVTQ